MRTEATFRALADLTRIRILRLLVSMELAVGELAQVLGQSQPRVSRHVAILCESGLAERRKEGSWVFLRLSRAEGPGGEVLTALSSLLHHMVEADPELAQACAQDRRRLGEIREAREAQAQDYFAANAHDWDELRQLHSSDEKVEAALDRALGSRELGRLLDVGTGTGRMAELFAGRTERVVALDKSLAMLRVARAKLQNLPTDHVDLVQGDFVDLPFDAGEFDTVLFHQVLHFAQSPAAVLSEAARVTRSGGAVAIVDFAAHSREDLREKHAHARLGFTDEQMHELLVAAGFSPAAPAALDDGELTVKIWVAERLAPRDERMAS